jgi:hypothetical protein
MDPSMPTGHGAPHDTPDTTMAHTPREGAGRVDADPRDPVTLSTQNARQANNSMMPLRVLVFSLGLAALAFVVVYVFAR